MRRAVQRADVYRGAELAGTIARTERGSTFAYDARYLARHGGERHAGVALGLPARPQPVETAGVNLHPFFANLLPEGARLAALLRAVRSSPDDLLSLAVAAGADTIGDVSILEVGVAPDEPRPTLDLARAGEVSFAELHAASVAYASPERAERMTIPGAQEKISAAMISFPVSAEREGAWMLKLEPPDYPKLVANEDFFLRAARACGLVVADHTTLRDRDGAPGLLVRRFDRRTERGGAVTKIHQEDALQLLARYPADKYAVSLGDVAGVLGVCEAPVLAVAWLIRLQAYSYVIANGDLHAKNVSVVVDAAGRVTPSPAYDLLSTLPYGDARMALSMDGRDARLGRERFVAFGARHGVRAAAVCAILDEVCDGIARFIPEVEAIGLAAKKSAHLRRTMAARRAELG